MGVCVFFPPSPHPSSVPMQACKGEKTQPGDTAGIPEEGRRGLWEAVTPPQEGAGSRGPLLATGAAPGIHKGDPGQRHCWTGCLPE